jgi:hypothetical protein
MSTITSKPETLIPKVEPVDSKIATPTIDTSGNQMWDLTGNKNMTLEQNKTATADQNKNTTTDQPPANSENKEEETDPKKLDTKTKYINLIKSFVKILLFILLSLLLGASVLYSCKVATSNILPTDVNCSPYTENEADVMPIDVDINIIKDADKIFSTKINFPFNEANDRKLDEIAEYNRSNFILDWIRKQKEVYNSWGIKMYFLSVLESLFQKNYSILSSTLHFMDKCFYEILVLFLGPWILFFMSGIVSFIMLFYSIYLFIVEFHWLFKENTNTKEGQKPIWASVTLANLFNYWLSCVMAFVVIISLILLYPLGFPLVSFFTNVIFLMCLFSATFMKSLISDGPNIGETYGIKKVFTDVLTSKMQYIMVIVSLVFISLSYSYFGSASAIFSIILFLLLFFGFIGNKLYKREMPADVTEGLINEEAKQAEKICTKVFGGGGYVQSGGEGNLLKQLKGLSKILKH